MLTYNVFEIAPFKCFKYKIRKDNNEILQQNSITESFTNEGAFFPRNPEQENIFLIHDKRELKCRNMVTGNFSEPDLKLPE
jgi:hypothetical protein